MTQTSPLLRPRPIKPMVTILRSAEDRSVNFVHHTGQESRFVRRTDEYFIAYLSSHNGCDKACRFCHLTQTKQTKMNPASLEDMERQLQFVLDHYKSTTLSGEAPKAKRINLNWMARGEPMDNVLLKNRQWPKTAQALAYQIRVNGFTDLDIRFNISTIFPRGLFNSELPNLDGIGGRTALYYSLYSMRPEFRKRWLPRAQDPKIALDALTTWQDEQKGRVVLHWAFIEGENDSEEDAHQVIETVRASGLRAKMNVVRYNPFSPAQGREPAEEVIAARFAQLQAAMALPGSRIVPRVGFDIKASCGMFVRSNAYEKMMEHDHDLDY